MRPPVTRREREIWHACDTLWEQKREFKEITGDVIAETLLELNYKKGSPNERYKYRATWKETRQVLSELEVPLPKSIFSDPINKAVSLVHEKIEQDLQKKFDQAKQLVLEKQAAVEKDLIEHQEEILKLKTIYNDQIVKTKKLEIALHNLEKEHQISIENLIKSNNKISILNNDLSNFSLREQTLKEQQALELSSLKENYQVSHDLLKANFKEGLSLAQKNVDDAKDAMERYRHEAIVKYDNLSVLNQEFKVTIANKNNALSIISQQLKTNVDEGLALKTRLEQQNVQIQSLQQDKLAQQLNEEHKDKAYKLLMRQLEEQVNKNEQLRQDNIDHLLLINTLNTENKHLQLNLQKLEAKLNTLEEAYDKS